MFYETDCTITTNTYLFNVLISNVPVAVNVVDRERVVKLQLSKFMSNA